MIKIVLMFNQIIIRINAMMTMNARTRVNERFSLDIIVSPLLVILWKKVTLFDTYVRSIIVTQFNDRKDDYLSIERKENYLSIEGVVTLHPRWSRPGTSVHLQLL